MALLRAHRGRVFHLVTTGVPGPRRGDRISGGSVQSIRLIGPATYPVVRTVPDRMAFFATAPIHSVPSSVEPFQQCVTVPAMEALPRSVLPGARTLHPSFPQIDDRLSDAT